jgi:hypothetical protein
MKKHHPLLFINLFTFVIALYAPRSPAQIQSAATRDFQPPQLLTPENGSKVRGVPEFFWTSAVLPKGFRGSYRLKVVPISPGQSPSAAITGNPPVHQATMRRTGEAYPADGPPLKSGQPYAWCVQVVDANGAPAGGDQGMSDVFSFSFESAGEVSSSVTGDNVINIDMGSLVMTGIRNDAPVEPAQVISIDMGSLVMTGIRNDALPEPAQVISIDMGPLVMTGIRNDAPAEPPRVIEIDMGPLVMTGIRNNAPPEPPRVIDIDMGPLVMTGIRNDAPAEPPRVIKIDMGPLVMTGIRTGQPKPPVEGNKTKIKPKVQEELKKKLDLPFKKPETVEGANPPAEPIGGAQMKQAGKGKTIGDTAINRILGKVPSVTTPSVPENPAANKTIGETVRDGKTGPLHPPVGNK